MSASGIREAAPALVSGHDLGRGTWWRPCRAVRWPKWRYSGWILHTIDLRMVCMVSLRPSTTMDYKLENRTCPVFQNVPFSAVDLANFLKSTLFLYFWKPCSCAHHYSTAVAVLGGLLVCLLVGYQARDTTCTVGSYLSTRSIQL